MIKSIFKLIRPKQWIKNFFIFPAILFSKEFLISDASNKIKFNYLNIYLTFLLFVIFSLLSSCVYILNDIIDIKEDKLHPKKRNRPIASGKISVKQALIIFSILFALVVFLSFFININTRIILLIYLFLNLLYSYYFKKIAVLDIFIIAMGFLLRAISGAVVIDANITKWFLITIFMISLTIASIKRRGEYFIKEDGRRHVLKFYNVEILDIFVSLSSISALLTYCIFALTYEIKSFYITIPFALYGIMRYLYVSYLNKEKAGDPDDVITSDFHMIVTGILFILSILFSMFVLH